MKLKPYIGPHPTDHTLTEYYLKSEADKVIANRDHEIEELKKSIGKLLKVKTEQVMDEVIQRCLIYGEGFVPVEHAMRLVADIHHHKYKRCLAMAKWCKDKVDAIKNGYIRSSIESQNGIMTTCPPECNPKFSFCSKWHKRWLKIAEKFKEAK